MALPKLDMPVYSFVVPSTGKEVRISPMRVKDEKFLLLAKEGKSPGEILLAIRQVVQNCLMDQSLDVNLLATFDVEALFVKLRSISLGSGIDATFSDPEDDNKPHTIKINLDDAKLEGWPMKMAEGTAAGGLSIPINSTACILLHYPTASLYDTPAFTDQTTSAQAILDAMVLNCLDSYFDGERTIPFKDSTKEEVQVFVDNLDIKTYQKIRDFLGRLPSMKYTLRYKNSKGEEKTILLSGLLDFFSL